MFRRITPWLAGTLATAGVLVVLADSPPAPSVQGSAVAEPRSSPTTPGASPASVLVLYRSNCPDANKNGLGDSEEIARYYAQRRGIPDRNLLGIRVEFEGDTSIENKHLAWPWEAYRKRVLEPVRKKVDGLGRTQIRYIVSIYGLPVQVNLAHFKRRMSADVALGSLYQLDDRGAGFRYGYDVHPGPRYGAPRFADVRARQADGPAEFITFIASRIDGPNVPACKAVVDGALYADRYTVSGYAYLDNRYGSYTDDDLRDWLPTARYVTYEDVDKTLSLSRLAFQDANIPVRQQPDYDVIGSKDGLTYTDGTPANEAARALLYAGWYNYAQYLNVWDWLPGSVAVDFNSASLFAPNTLFASFGTMAIFHGVSGVVGVFGEPGTGGHPMPDILMHYYLKGFSFGEAAWLSIPSKPYFAYAIGDPLMRPYGRTREKDTTIEEPKVTLKRDGTTLRAFVQVTDDIEIVRARMVVSREQDDSLLPVPDRRAGLYAREHRLGVPVPDYRPVKVGLVSVDPAGNVSRTWLNWEEKQRD